MKTILLYVIAVGISSPLLAQSMSSIDASIAFDSSLKQVRFEREGEAVVLSNYSVPATFAQPNGEPRILKVLLDPRYIEPLPNAQAADFTVRMQVRAKGSSQPLSSVGLCRWQRLKTVANCNLEDDGGTFQVVVMRRGKTLKRSHFALRIARLGETDGIYIGRSTTEPDASILVRSATSKPATVSIVFP